MTDGPGKLRKGALSFAAGLHFALLQSAYFLLLEAYLSSRALSYFVTLLFWLVGLVIGLRLPARVPFGALLAAGAAAYYAVFLLAKALPFHPGLHAAAAAGSIVSGLSPGFFFMFIVRRYTPARSPLFHENNGFLVGLLVALRGAIHFEGRMLAYGPAITGTLVALALVAARDRARRSPA
jgi:hypothetical protein